MSRLVRRRGRAGGSAGHTNLHWGWQSDTAREGGGTHGHGRCKGGREGRRGGHLHWRRGGQCTPSSPRGRPRDGGRQIVLRRGCSETTGVRAGAGKWAKGPADAPPLAGGGRAGVDTVFFSLGLWTRFRAILFPNTTRASPICSSVPQVEMWHSSCKPSAST